MQENSTPLASYALDGRGERVRKTPAGNLLAEHNGAAWRDYLWVDDTLVATLDGTNLHDVYTDGLGTPRAVTTTTNTPVWTWPYTENPFGEQPATGSAYTLNLRFPGQYYDAEDALHYNMHRDYEPGTGRYIENDSAGLTAGPNTYAYVSVRPLRYVDWLGFDGCGPEGKPIEAFIPNNPLGFPFEQCCVDHDHCYDNCKGGSKSDCDGKFCGCVHLQWLYVGAGGDAFVTCQSIASIYCDAVVSSKTAGEQFKKAREKCRGPGCGSN